jgi:heme/copper-type cytochrome/quinol oxidase subunit 3
MTRNGLPQPDNDFKGGFQPPRRAALLGLYLFLAALAMLFLSGMLGYVIVRTRLEAQGTTIHWPAALWLSTALILLSSYTLHRAVKSVRHERQRAFRRYLAASLALGLGFVAVQAPSLWVLLAEHKAAKARGLPIYGLIFFLVLLHALHVLGGIIALTRVNLGAWASRYDHEHHEPVRYAAIYWHFIDGVWVFMFTLMRIVS